MRVEQGGSRQGSLASRRCRWPLGHLRSLGAGPLPIGQGQTISQPYIVGFMSQELKLNKRMVVLEFPSMEQARRWYASAEYRSLLAMRQRSTKSKVVLIEGT